jgi:hypothetical protein
VHGTTHCGFKNGESEDGHAEVDEDVRLGDDGNALVRLRGEVARAVGHVPARVHGHDHAAEEDADDARQLERLRSEVGRPWEGEGEGRLHEDELAVVAHVHGLEDEGRGDARDGADEERAAEDGAEGDDRRHDRLRVNLGAGHVEAEQRAREDDGNGIVEDRLAEDHREEVDLDAERLEDGEDGDGVGGGDERAERQRSQHAERVAQTELPRFPDEATHDKRGGKRADEGKEHGRDEVVDEGRHVHVVAGLEDDGWQQPNHEELKVEAIVLRHRVVV